ncbi:hypothetical protein [Gloeothece verrucosa]|uniref:tRNA-guanine(15) transglycosylase-like domain-containing protein n=1 Tax=Gloeothece verrucosa (strain PCC 7822) TaxID=497965 RepID=E0UMD4_GLOV7|nr:hypothetical protein [Gloeothece verrucosa]ADN18114.1 conserved hypothetical protein [Gloeothece verrucosa PCC 7822]
MTQFVPFIGKTDYFNSNPRLPLWQLIPPPVLPLSWLLSLNINPGLIPPFRIIPDCGVWSYKNLKIPRIGNNLVTPLWAIKQYQKRAKPGDIVIAIDHLLMGINNEERREFNRQSSQQFLKLSKLYLPQCYPMAVIHGIGISQKLQELKRLYHLGYRYFAVGGLLSNSHNQHQLLGIVEIIKNHLSDNCYLHILGVSNYQLAGKFGQLAINSHDSSTWIKEAFLGYYYHWKNNKLNKLKLSSINLPSCSCTACSFLGVQLLSRREYKLKLAAHNLIQNLLAYGEYQCREKPLSLL